MARYVTTYKITGNMSEAYSYIQQYLFSEGYELINFEGENVFKKGHGVVSGPSIFKLTISGEYLILETWMKYAVLPGVYAGEIGTTGFLGWAAKGPWKNRLEYIEGMLSRYGVCVSGQQNIPRPESYQGGASHSAGFGADNRCAKCGAPLAAGAEFCMNCGTKTVKAEVCKVCGAPLAKDAVFCVNCGNKVPAQAEAHKKFCAGCGTELPQGAEFCMKCGRKL